tara:strand:+ start:217 stop:630 length:414 start_codon:yes stop_codon:yes gene_type:complete
MTYLYEYTILDDNIKVEYTFSTVTDGIKVVDMWVDDKPHSVNWMGPEARAKLMTRLEEDMTNRMCGTTDDESYMDNLMTTGFGEVSEQDEYFEGGGYNGFETEVDLDRDMPGFEGTWDELEDMVDNVVGEPEYLGGR